MSLQWQNLDVEQTGTATGHCECCGNTTKRSWGVVSDPDGPTLAAYFVSWTDQRPDHGATFDLIVGKWGDGTTSFDRVVVSFDFSIIKNEPSFMVVDATDRLPNANSLASRKLQRNEVIGRPMSDQMFAILDATFMKDPWIVDLHTWA